MGANLSSGSNRMAIAAMSHVVAFDKDELLKMQKEFHKLSKKHGHKNTISREDFGEALKIVGVRESDKEILDRLFTLVDELGDNEINFKEFITGIAPIVRGTLVEKLNFAFHLYDLKGTGKVTKEEMLDVLSHMNKAASYFGDDMMDKDKVKEVVDQIFEESDKGHDGALDYSEFMDAVAAHPNIVEFVKGDGGAGAKDEAATAAAPAGGSGAGGGAGAAAKK